MKSAFGESGVGQRGLVSRWSDAATGGGIRVVAALMVIVGGPAARGGELAPAERRIDAISGRTLVVPMTAVGVSPAETAPARWMPKAEPVVRVVGAAEPRTGLAYIWNATPAEGDRGWMPATPMWDVSWWSQMQAPEVSVAPGKKAAASAPAPARPDAPGFWALVIEPIEVATGRHVAVSVDGVALPVRWLETPPMKTDVARSPRLDAGADALAALGDMIESSAADPIVGWREALLADRLGAMALWSGGTPRPETGPLAALARQNEDRWRAAIARLQRADADLAADVLHTLTCVVRAPGGGLLPAWPLDEASAQSLRAALLAPDARDDRVVEVARAWLGATPAAVAWIDDDSEEVASDEPGMPPRRRVRLGIAERRGREVIASASDEGQAARNPVRLGAHESVRLTAEATVEKGASLGRIVARAGEWSAPLSAIGVRLTVSPPGLVLGPLLPPWRLATWLAGRAESVRPDGAVLVQRSVDGSRWEVYVECLKASAPGNGDMVTLWFGPYGGAAATVKIGPGASGAGEIPSTDLGDRWTAMVSVPPGAIEANGTVRLGITRQVAEGEVWAWPRPLLPGQSEPGRAILDLNGWDGLGPEPASPGK